MEITTGFTQSSICRGCGEWWYDLPWLTRRHDTKQDKLTHGYAVERAPVSLFQLVPAISTLLASIFGCGFLVIVSILASSVEPYSVWVMDYICGNRTKFKEALKNSEVLRHKDVSPFSI